MTRRSEILRVRLADAELARLRGLADAAGVTMSGYVRASILAETATRSAPARSPHSVAPGPVAGRPDGAAPAWSDADPRHLLRERDRQARAVLARANRGE